MRGRQKAGGRTLPLPTIDRNVSGSTLLSNQGYVERIEFTTHSTMIIAHKAEPIHKNQKIDLTMYLAIAEQKSNQGGAHLQPSPCASIPPNTGPRLGPIIGPTLNTPKKPPRSCGVAMSPITPPPAQSSSARQRQRRGLEHTQCYGTRTPERL